MVWTALSSIDLIPTTTKTLFQPKLNGDVQKEIAEKVHKAHKQHKESLALLSTAKARVEELIETATK